MAPISASAAVERDGRARIVVRKHRWWILPRSVDHEIVRLVASDLLPPFERALYATSVGWIGACETRPEAERRRALRLLVDVYNFWLAGVREDDAFRLIQDVGAAYFGEGPPGWDLDGLAHVVQTWRPRS